MCRPKRISSPIAATVALVFSFNALCHAQGEPIQKGKLVIASEQASSVILGPKRPPCKEPPLCIELIAELKRVLRLKGLAEIGILIIPAGADTELSGFSVEIHSKKGVLFRTQPIDEVLKATSTAKQTSGVYLFKLDKSAVEAGNQFFVDENSLVLTVKTNGKVEPKIQLVNAANARVP